MHQISLEASKIGMDLSQTAIWMFTFDLYMNLHVDVPNTRIIKDSFMLVLMKLQVWIQENSLPDH